MCPHGIAPPPRDKHMPEALIDKIRPLLDHATSFQLHSIGEPILSGSFWKVLEMLDDRSDAIISVNSNGLLLSDERIDRLLDSPLTDISISCDAATAETYRRIRGAELDEAIDAVRRLIRRRDAAGLKHPRVSMNMTLMRENIEEAVAFVELAHSLGADAVALWHLNDVGRGTVLQREDWTFDYDAQQLLHFPELSNRCLAEASERARDLGIELQLSPNKPMQFDEGEATDDETRRRSDVTVRDCPHPWQWASVSSDGEVMPCCMSLGSLGNLNEADSFDEVWNGPVARQTRRDILADRVPRICRGACCKYVIGSARNGDASARDRSTVPLPIVE
jgi:MoaA/NifB/PqqE/SkfB family radical SAM enzyme